MNTIPENILFISAQPYDQYFLWQLEVQITNFREHNISDKMHVLVWHVAPGHKDYPVWQVTSLKWKALEEKYPEVKFFFYEDQGVDLGLYISQLRPHILKMHFEKYDLSDKIIFYHDSDIIFNYLPDFQSLSKDDICWQSDCSGYLDYNYLISKEKQGNIPEHLAVQRLADIGGITVDVIKSYAGKTGGAQTILKGVDHKFWEDVEKMCIDIRKSFYWGRQESPNVGSINHTYFSNTASAIANENAGFQSWCADMWALNFSLWKRGKETNVTSELDFSWATDTAETYHKKPIFHNAGATRVSGLFFKGDYIQSSPIGADLKIPPKGTASYFYVQAIKKVK